MGLVVENGYMFEMDPDMSSFPVITWHCPKLRSLLQEYSPCQYSGNLYPSVKVIKPDEVSLSMQTLAIL